MYKRSHSIRSALFGLAAVATATLIASATLTAQVETPANKGEKKTQAQAERRAQDNAAQPGQQPNQPQRADQRTQRPATGEAATDARRQGEATAESRRQGEAGAEARRQGEADTDVRRRDRQGSNEQGGAWLGVYLHENADQPGARVSSVYPASPAARAGFRPGDVLLEVNGQKLSNSSDLISAIENMEPRSRAEVVVLRNDQQLNMPVVLGSRETYVSNEYGDDEYQGENDEYNFPLHAMQMEHDRRNAEQHQRIEMQIQKLHEEVRKLREAIEQRK